MCSRSDDPSQHRVGAWTPDGIALHKRLHDAWRGKCGDDCWIEAWIVRIEDAAARERDALREALERVVAEYDEHRTLGPSFLTIDLARAALGGTGDR